MKNVTRLKEDWETVQIIFNFALFDEQLVNIQLLFSQFLLDIIMMHSISHIINLWQGQLCCPALLVITIYMRVWNTEITSRII